MIISSFWEYLDRLGTSELRSERAYAALAVAFMITVFEWLLSRGPLRPMVIYFIKSLSSPQPENVRKHVSAALHVNPILFLEPCGYHNRFYRRMNDDDNTREPQATHPSPHL